ncbi:MAG: helix-turn-helix transcriptional regulator [Clostridium butyricum]|nr:helix-turn-helix transcriptional regulator [Clostridium butyricum]
MNIGERIKKLRKEKGLSVDYIAEKLGKNRATVYRYESSEIENLPYPILVPLADILGTTPMYLIGCEVQDIKVTKEEKQLLDNYNKLNSKGKEKLLDYSDDLTTNIKYMDNTSDEISATKDESMPIAAHANENATKEDIKHDMDIMNDDSQW